MRHVQDRAQDSGWHPRCSENASAAFTRLIFSSSSEEAGLAERSNFQRAVGPHHILTPWAPKPKVVKGLRTKDRPLALGFICCVLKMVVCFLTNHSTGVLVCITTGPMLLAFSPCL